MILKNGMNILIMPQWEDLSLEAPYDIIQNGTIMLN